MNHGEHTEESFDGFHVTIKNTFLNVEENEGVEEFASKSAPASMNVNFNNSKVKSASILKEQEQDQEQEQEQGKDQEQQFEEQEKEKEIENDQKIVLQKQEKEISFPTSQFAYSKEFQVQASLQLKKLLGVPEFSNIEATRTETNKEQNTSNEKEEDKQNQLEEKDQLSSSSTSSSSLHSYHQTSNKENINNNLNNNNRDNTPEEFCLSIDKLQRQEEKRTTLMIKNIPNKYSQKMLLESLDKHRGNFDFFYLPIDFKNKCNVGYAFINFIRPEYIIPFYLEFNGINWEKFNSQKICSLSFARIQGKSAMISHFSNSRLLAEDRKCRPLIFASDGWKSGEEEEFPVGPNFPFNRHSYGRPNNRDDRPSNRYEKKNSETTGNGSTYSQHIPQHHQHSQAASSWRKRQLK